MNVYLPKMHNKLKEFEQWKDKTEMRDRLNADKAEKEKKKEQEDNSNDTTKYAVTNLKTDVDHIKKIWSSAKLTEIDAYAT